MFMTTGCVIVVRISFDEDGEEKYSALYLLAATFAFLLLQANYAPYVDLRLARLDNATLMNLMAIFYMFIAQEVVGVSEGYSNLILCYIAFMGLYVGYLTAC